MNECLTIESDLYLCMSNFRVVHTPWLNIPRKGRDDVEHTDAPGSKLLSSKNSAKGHVHLPLLYHNT